MQYGSRNINKKKHNPLFLHDTLNWENPKELTENMLDIWEGSWRYLYFFLPLFC